MRQFNLTAFYEGTGTHQFSLDNISYSKPSDVESTSTKYVYNALGQVRYTIGEIVVRGNVVFEGYWKDPSATAEAMSGGWFHTGDLATIDAEGYVSENVYDANGNVVETKRYENAINKDAVATEHDVQLLLRASWSLDFNQNDISELDGYRHTIGASGYPADNMLLQDGKLVSVPKKGKGSPKGTHSA